MSWGRNRDASENQVRTLSESEDLVIDGETVIDDLLVASRIAQQEERAAEEIRLVRRVAEASSKGGPNRADVEKLMQLLRQTSQLTAKIGELPSELSALVSDEVRTACKTAAAAVERNPIPEAASPQDALAEDGYEDPDARHIDHEEALAGVDLASTSEEEGEQQQPALAKAASVAAQKGTSDAGGEAQAAPQIGSQVKAEEAEDEENEDVEENAEAADPCLQKVKEQPFEDEGAPVIKTEHLPERVGEKESKDPVGELYSCVDGLLCVRGEEDGRALDLQSVICTKDGVVLGVVVDIFGPVTQPHYLVFATKQEKPTIGIRVFAATSLADTSYLCDSADPVTLRQRLADRLADDSDDDDGDESEEDSSEQGDGQRDVPNAEQSLASQLLGEFASERSEQRSSKGKGKGKGKEKGKGKGKGKGKKGKAGHKDQHQHQDAVKEEVPDDRDKWRAWDGQGTWSNDEGPNAKKQRYSDSGDRGSSSASFSASTLPPPPLPPPPPPVESIFVPPSAPLPPPGKRK